MILVKEKRRNNIKEIIQVMMNNDIMSLAEITNQVSLSLPKVTEIVKGLCKLNLVNEIIDEDVITIGRPSIKFQLNSTSGYVIGIDLGRIYSNFVVLDFSQKKIYEKHTESILNKETKEVAKILNKFVNQIFDELKLTKKQLIGIGVSLPGIVDGKNGISYTYLKLDNTTIKEYLEKTFGVNVRIEHDVKSMSLGELYYGKNKYLDNTIYLNFGWGLGIGIIINNKLFYGKNSYSGEFGHIPVISNGELCYCGKTGCLETVASGRAITKKVRDKLSAGASSIILITIQDPEQIEPLDILRAANKGDQFSIEILEEAGKFLGIGIAMLINIFNPDRIIIGGTFTQVANYILDVAKNNAMKHSLTQLNKHVKFEISNLTNNAGALGIARLTALENCFKLIN